MRLRPHIYFRRFRAVFNYPSWLTGIARTLDIGGTFDPPLLSVDDLWLKYDKLAWEKRRMSYEPWAERCPSCKRMLGVQTEMDKLLSAVRDEAFAEARDEAWEEVHREMDELRQKLASTEERGRLEREVIKAAKLWRKYRIGANEVELEWAVRDLDEYESRQR